MFKKIKSWFKQEFLVLKCKIGQQLKNIYFPVSLRNKTLPDVDCRATSDRTAQASPLARVDRLPALDFRRRAVVVAQTGPCLHQRWARCGHMASEQNTFQTCKICC